MPTFKAGSPEMSAYLTALNKHNAAIRVFEIAKVKYRERAGSFDEATGIYLEAKRVYDEATREFDAAYEEEQNRE